MKLTVYGIKNCDTCRLTQRWLNERGISFTFHDLRVDGLTGELLTGWLESDQASKLVNRRSTSWRKLTEDEKQAAGDNPLPVLLANPTLIKRPVITDGDTVLAVGFSADNLEKLLQG